MSVWRRGLYGAMALVVTAAAAAAVYVARVLPKTSGTVRLEGMANAVEIERDADGVPTIRAPTLRDALFGLGYAHAQDRLWQLETHRRIASGRLAEAFGPAALDNDRFLRALGVRRAAEAQWARVGGEARDLVLAYTAGINAWIGEAMAARPPEFVLLGIEPQAWEPVDTMGWLIMMAWDLGANWSGELLRLRLAQRLPGHRIDELLPPYPGESPRWSVDYAAALRRWQVADRGQIEPLTRFAAAAPPVAEATGSNNWALSGARTRSGAPLLANDPHLKLTAPALWYLARIETPQLRIAGATMPGVPLIVLGQNEHIAWGFTNTAADVQDLYLERIKPDDPSRYQTPDGWARFETSAEVIKVRGAPDVSITVRRTRHGPVVSDAGAGADVLGASPAHAIAMRWVALDADPGTLITGFAFNIARSVDEFVERSAGYVAPMQNMLVADGAGRIAFVAAGRVPKRGTDNDLHGLAPAPGWLSRYDWEGFVDARETPRQMDAPAGWLATANQRIHAPDYPHFITSEWTPPYRQQRIESLLGARARHTVDDMTAMQNDSLSLATLRLLPHLRKARSTHPLAARVQAGLVSFDGVMATGDARPLLFWAWVRHLTQGLLADEVGAPLYERTIGSRSFREAVEGILERDDAWWCDDKTTAAAETCQDQIDGALTRALDELAGRFGDDIGTWRWGDAHEARSEHRPFSRVGLLASVFELHTPVPGDTYSINVSRVALKPDPEKAEPYRAEHGASLRAIYDLGDRSASRVMLSTGQSGIVFSPLYRRWVKPWARGEYVPLWADREPEDVLRLEPAR